jgi:hypothetical protein
MRLDEQQHERHKRALISHRIIQFLETIPHSLRSRFFNPPIKNPTANKMHFQLFYFLAMLAIVAADVKEFTWTLTWDNDVTVDPSLYTKRMIVINGTW